MPNFHNIPDWLGAGVVTVAIATAAYIFNAAASWIAARRERNQKLDAALVQLNALLKATAVTFTVQRENVYVLCTALKKRKGLMPTEKSGYEEFLANAYKSMLANERERHGIIRAMTMDMMRPLNMALLDWIKADTFFKSQSGRGDLGDLARELAALELHLLMWNAKYEAWIPDHPNHALVYLQDEAKHGIGFPQKISAALAKLLPN